MNFLDFEERLAFTVQLRIQVSNVQECCKINDFRSFFLTRLAHNHSQSPLYFCQIFQTPLILFLLDNPIPMVDRYKSLLGSQLMSDNIRNIKVDKIVNNNMEMISRTNEHAAKMREYIAKYKRDPTNQGDRYVEMFKKEQKQYAKDRNYLKGQLDKLEKDRKKDTSEFNFMKKELIKAVKTQFDLECELNKEITDRKQRKEQLKKNLIQGSVQLQNALSDIEAKKAEILYLQRLIQECLQLFQIIGVLVHQNGEKIDQISDRVKDANVQIQRAQKNIEKGIINMQKSRCKMCCILILAAIVIVLGLIVYFGVFFQK